MILCWVVWWALLLGQPGQGLQAGGDWLLRWRRPSVAVLAAAVPRPGQDVSYFAYGSNCDLKTLSRRLGVSGTSELCRKPGVLTDHRLKFSVVGLPGFEPSFASVCPSPGQLTVGVLYTLSSDQFDVLCATEGVPYVYTVLEVNCITTDTDRTEENVAAKTLIAAQSRCFPLGLEVRPSSRYLNLILTGLAESGAPLPFIAKIRNDWWT